MFSDPGPITSAALRAPITHDQASVSLVGPFVGHMLIGRFVTGWNGGVWLEVKLTETQYPGK